MRPSDIQIRDNTIEAIKQSVADIFSVSSQELGQRDTRRAVTIPRQIAMYLAKQMTDASLPEIGRHIGGMHHTTVMHSNAKIEEQRRTVLDMDNAVMKILKTLKMN